MSYQLVIFDKDGTLLENNATWGDAMMRTLEDIASGDQAMLGKLHDVVGLERNTGVFREDSLFLAADARSWIEDMCHHAQIPCTEELISRVTRDLHNYTLSAVTPAPGARECIKQLRDLGYRLAVATNSTEEEAKNHLRLAGWDGCFDMVVGADSGFGAKPGPGMLEAIIEQTASHRDKTIMVGDTIYDLMAAHRCGVQAVLVTNGSEKNTRSDGNNDFGDYHVIANLAEMTILMDNLPE